MPSIDLAFGPLDYRTTGPDDVGSPTAVFVHGFLANATLWDPVAEQLATAGVRCILPDWPLGAHRRPARPASDLSPPAMGTAVLELLDRLDLSNVTLVGSDSGGAICQLALKGDHTRIAALVLTNCDTFENFPPPAFVPLFWAARHERAVWALAQVTRSRPARHSPVAFGPLLTKPRPAALTRGWMQPALDDPAIRHDIARFARSVRRDELLGAESWLANFDKPVRLVWGTRDRHFSLKWARRLAAALPQATVDEVFDATTFVSIDNPTAVALAVRELTPRVVRE